MNNAAITDSIIATLEGFGAENLVHFTTLMAAIPSVRPSDLRDAVLALETAGELAVNGQTVVRFPR